MTLQLALTLIAAGVLAYLAVYAVVLIHELGHAIMLRLVGVPVLGFECGVGPALHFRWRSLPVRLGVIPMRGMVTGADKGIGDPRLWYSNKPLWARAAVLLGGALANLLSAWLVLALCLFISGAGVLEACATACDRMLLVFSFLGYVTAMIFWWFGPGPDLPLYLAALNQVVPQSLWSLEVFGLFFMLRSIAAVADVVTPNPGSDGCLLVGEVGTSITGKPNTPDRQVAIRNAAYRTIAITLLIRIVWRVALGW